MPHLINLSNQDIDSEYNLEGYDVYDAAGEKLGDIDGVVVDGDTMQPRYVVVDTGGWFSTKQFVVPAGDIRTIDDDDHHVYFQSLTKETLESGCYPRYDESWWDSNDHEGFSEYERGIAAAYQPEQGERAQVDYDSDLYRGPRDGAQRLRLMEERLRAVKERYQAGAVRLGKRIVEHEETVEVPVREERVVIERTPVTGRARPGEIAATDEMVEVSVMRERVTVEKETVVTEEVNVRTEATERTKRVQDTVRKEELVIEEGEDLIDGRPDATR